MSAATSGAGCGLVLGLVIVLLAQQFGFLPLSALVASLEYLALGALVGMVIGAAYGRVAGGKYRRSAPPRSA